MLTRECGTRVSGDEGARPAGEMVMGEPSLHECNDLDWELWRLDRTQSESVADALLATAGVPGDGGSSYEYLSFDCEVGVGSAVGGLDVLVSESGR